MYVVKDYKINYRPNYFLMSKVTPVYGTHILFREPKLQALFDFVS